MIEQNRIDEVKKLIESGFDLELISFELDIPIEEVKQCQKHLECSKKNDVPREYYYDRAADYKKNKHTDSKMEKMREKYRQLFLKSNKVEIVLPKQLSKEDMELIETVIETVEEKIQQMKTLSKTEKRKIASTVLAEFKKVEDYKLQMPQAEKLYELINSEELKELNMYNTDNIDKNIDKQRGKTARQFSKAIEVKQYEVYDDIVELNALQRKITNQLIMQNPIVEGLKSKITNRISSMRQQNAIERIKNDIPASISTVITDLVNGNLDMQKANIIIDEEAKKRVESKPKTRFALTEEGQRRQVLLQIEMAIEENYDIYSIKNPEKTITQIEGLLGGELDSAVRTVVKNLIQRKEFETAKNVCSKFASKNKEIKREIRNSEIGNMVLTAINMNGTPEEERKCFELIEKGLNSGNVKLEAIPLGKSKDGLRNIKLSEIWETEKTR